MRAINREVLYEKACDLEAQALAYVGKIVNDETKIEEWRIWSAILAERTAFKHDVFDAPTIEPEPHWIPCSERMPNRDEYIKNNGLFNVSDGNRSYSEWFDVYDKQRFGEPTMYGFRIDYAVAAWMPLPEPYKKENR